MHSYWLAKGQRIEPGMAVMLCDDGYLRVAQDGSGIGIGGQLLGSAGELLDATARAIRVSRPADGSGPFVPVAKKE